MNFERADVTRYLYTAAVLVSGIYVEQWFSASGPMALVVGLLVAIAWTLYYKARITSTLEALEERNPDRR